MISLSCISGGVHEVPNSIRGVSDSCLSQHLCSMHTVKKICTKFLYLLVTFRVQLITVTFSRIQEFSFAFKEV